MFNKVLFPLLIICTCGWGFENAFAVQESGCFLQQWDFSLYTGYLTAHTQELVLNRSNPELPYRVSELDWDMENLPLLGGKVKAHMLDNQVHMSLDGWTKVSPQRGFMTDYDFFDVTRPSYATHTSWHPNTKLKEGFAIDFEVNTDILLLMIHNASSQNTSVFSVGLLEGLRFVKLHWDVYGGDYLFDGEYGLIPSGVHVIEYTQQMFVPYLGLQLDACFRQNISLSAYAKYTNLACIRNDDEHLMREIHFIDQFTGANYWVFGGEVDAAVENWLSLNVRGSYEIVNFAKGDTYWKSPEGDFYSKGSAGLRFKQWLFAIGATARF